MSIQKKVELKRKNMSKSNIENVQDPNNEICCSEDEIKMLNNFRTVTPKSKKRVLNSLSEQTKLITKAECISFMEQAVKNQQKSIESNLQLTVQGYVDTHFSFCADSLKKSSDEMVKRLFKEEVGILEKLFYERQEKIETKFKTSMVKHNEKIKEDLWKFMNSFFRKQDEECKNRNEILKSNLNELRRKHCAKNDHPQNKKSKLHPSNDESTYSSSGGSMAQYCYACEFGMDCIMHTK